MADNLADSKVWRNPLFYILGSQTLSHETLSFFLQHEFKAECVILDGNSLEKLIQDVKISETHQILFLVNGSEDDVEAILTKLHSISRTSTQRLNIALFNLQIDSRIEKWAFAKGVQGFFYKSDTLKHMLKGLQSLLRGEIWMARSLLADFALQGNIAKGGLVVENTNLTQREVQVLALVSVGASNEEIAEKLFISQHTVKTHLYNVFKKINVPNRFQAALWAAKHL